MFDFELGEQEEFLPLFQDAFAFVKRSPKVGQRNRWLRTSANFGAARLGWEGLQVPMSGPFACYII